MLHCAHLNERLEFGMEHVAILSQSFINAGPEVIPCKTVMVDLGLNEINPGLAPNGAKCGDGKVSMINRDNVCSLFNIGAYCIQAYSYDGYF